MSDHKIEVIKLEDIAPHGNADRLEIVTVWGYTCVVAKGQFKTGDLAAYVIPDSVVDTSIPEFAFLREKDGKVYEKKRIKAAKYRGIPSQGLLISARRGWKVGDDVSDELKIEHYEPAVSAAQVSGKAERTPMINGMPATEYTDIQNFRRHHTTFDDIDGDVVITEKIHGANFRAVHDGKRVHVGSHHQWKRMHPNAFHKFLVNLSQASLYRRLLKAVFGQKVFDSLAIGNDNFSVLARGIDLETKLAKFPGFVLYGEIYGTVQKGYPYDSTATEPLKVRFFDVKSNDRYLDYDSAKQAVLSLGLEWVPELYRGPWDKDKALALAEGKTTLGGKHIREGCVVKPVKEVTHLKLGRLILKVVGQSYLEKD